MPIVPTFNANANSMGPDSQGCFHFEGYASTEAEVMEYRTDYQVGSIIICGGPATGGVYTLWFLSCDASDPTKKVWTKATVA